MIKKTILFFFSPFFAVCSMVIPDAWTIYERVNASDKASFAVQMASRQEGDADYEIRAWNGDAEAIEKLGERYASLEDTSEWDRTVKTWNKMYGAFFLPFVVMSGVLTLIGLFAAIIDRQRINRGLEMRYLPKVRAKVDVLKRHWGFIMTLWMAGGYYLFRYWMVGI